MNKKSANYILNITHLLNQTKNILINLNNKIAFDYADWTYDKCKIKFKSEFPNFKITNNYVYWCNLGINIGSEQNKLRPAIVIKTKLNSTTCTIIPLTSKRKNDTRYYHIDLENIDSTALIEQLRNVSKLRIIKPHRLKGDLSKITINDWNKINFAVQKYYSLTKLK